MFLDLFNLVKLLYVLRPRAEDKIPLVLLALGQHKKIFWATILSKYQIKFSYKQNPLLHNQAYIRSSTGLLYVTR